jgi:hypothetical protein
MKKILILTICLFLLITNLASAANTYSAHLAKASAQYYTITDAAQTGLDIAGDFTFELWVKFDSLPGDPDKDYGFIRKYYTSGNRSYYFSLREHNYTYALFGVLSSDGAGTLSVPTVSWTPTTATWYHLAMVYDHTAATVKYYVNDTQQGATQTGQVTSIYNSTQAFYIGYGDIASGAQYNDYFDGSIDDVRIWTVAKTQAQLAASASTELVGNESGLVAYWKFNNAATDSTSNSNNLTAVNTPTYTTDVPFSGITSSCTPPATGNWNVLAKDNCYVNTNTYVQGQCILLGTDGPGSLNIIDGAHLACHGIVSTSTPINGKVGSFIDLDAQ